MEERSYRNEYKHEISQKSRIILRSRLRKMLAHDTHCQDNSYFIKSLYFDTLNDDALTEKINGEARREKFRIRYYNHDDHFIKLEKKVKEYNAGYKMSTQLTRPEAEAIISGDLSFLSRSDDPLKQEFCLKAKLNAMMPKVIVSYDREAFAYRPGNTRITLDSNLQASGHISDFFLKDHFSMKESHTDCVLEIKYDRYLPEWIREIVQVGETTSCAHSKYMIGRQLIG